ncbi:hypothetical protein [Providencia hangzhouensis]|uniref:hypothetical protein n=1 Tax=Providencia hangzhouensis TaxID=3031799 RepID=UPI0034DD1883
MVSETESTKKEHVYIKTDELASRYGLTPHSIRLWAGMGSKGVKASRNQGLEPAS